MRNFFRNGYWDCTWYFYSGFYRNSIRNSWNFPCNSFQNFSRYSFRDSLEYVSFIDSSMNFFRVSVMDLSWGVFCHCSQDSFGIFSRNSFRTSSSDSTRDSFWDSSRDSYWIPAEILLGLRSEFPLLFFFSLLVHQDFWVWFVISSGIHSGITPGIPSLILTWIPFKISPDIHLGIPPDFFH